MSIQQKNKKMSIPQCRSKHIETPNLEIPLVKRFCALCSMVKYGKMPFPFERTLDIEVKTAGLSTGAKLKVLASGSSRPYLQATRNSSIISIISILIAFSQHSQSILIAPMDFSNQQLRMKAVHIKVYQTHSVSWSVRCTLELFHTFRRFPSDGIMLKRHEIGLARSVLPKVKATAHHCATHASHISTRCENFHSRNPVLTFNFTTTLCNPSKYQNSLIIPNSNLPAVLLAQARQVRRPQLRSPMASLQLRNFGISFTGNFSGSTCKCSQSLSTGFMEMAKGGMWS